MRKKLVQATALAMSWCMIGGTVLTCSAQENIEAVSYTHLDVYKRQQPSSPNSVISSLSVIL